jgi:hypothetical protein
MNATITGIMPFLSNTNHKALKAAFFVLLQSGLSKSIIYTATTIHVGSTRAYTSLYAAWVSIQNTLILAPLTIKLDDGSYTQPNMVFNNHPSSVIFSQIV